MERDIKIEESTDTTYKEQKIVESAVMVERDDNFEMEIRGGDMKKSEERIFSKLNIPSINEIDFDIKNENFISQNMLEPIMREEDWKSNKDYQSIMELNSDLFFKYHV